MDPYRSADPDAIAEAPSDQGIVGDIIAQFADRFAFFRELVQNAIDAGTPAIEVRITYDDETRLLHAAVVDRGEGMTRDVIENQLLVLFRSTKESDHSKIGKFGIGFASVLSPNPEVVTVSSTRDGRRLVLHLARDLTYRLFDAGPATQPGTTVELEIAMPPDSVAAFVDASHAALVRWCRHASVPIEFRGLDAPVRRIDRPLELDDAVVSVTGTSADGQLVAIVGITAGPTRVSFYNHGLTLFETTDGLVGDATVKIQDSRLGHTLSRDDVKRDAIYDRAIAFAHELASVQLPAAINAQLAAAAEANDHVRHREIVDAASIERDSRVIAGLVWRFPLVVPHDGAASCDVAKPRVLWASDDRDGELARIASAELGVPVFAAHGRHEWLVNAMRTLTGKPVKFVERELTQVIPIDDPADDAVALLAWVGEILEKVYRAPSKIIAATLRGANHHRLAIAGHARGRALVDADDAAASPFGRLKRPPLVINLEHAYWKHACAKDPRLGASLIARTILLGYQVLDGDRSTALLDDTFARLGDPVTYRPPPGEQLGSGRIRVDAAKAIAKLREYQLADRHAWILECIRAAVAAGATAIELAGDADDVWLAWIGSPLAVDDLPRLFDELVSPEAVESRHHLRLLAAGVNTALGLGPDDRVEIYTSAGDAIWRVHYTPGVMTEEALRALRAAPVDGAARAVADTYLRGRPGVVVHLHRAASLAVLARYLFSTEPPELVLARAACRDLAVPLAIGTTMLSREHGTDVVRIPLGEGLDGFVAVTEVPAHPNPADDWHPVLEMAERGVVLARDIVGVIEGPRVPVPLRVFVDAPRLPTDASRSQVRMDAHPIDAAIKRARALLPDVIAALIAKAPTDPRARASALALLASAAGGADSSWRAPPKRFAPLAHAKLMRDATGEPRAASAPWSGVIYKGKRPLDAALAPWLEGMLWIPPGDPAEPLSITYDARASSRFIRSARRQRRAHAAFFEHATRKSEVVARITPRVRMPIAAGCEASALDAARFANLSGEICVYGAATGGELVVLWQGRELERVTFATQIAFDAIIDSPELRAGDRYRSAIHDDAYDRVVAAMRAAVYRAIELVAHAAQGGAAPRGVVFGEPDRARDAELVHRALALGQVLDAPLRGPLATVGAWSTATGGWVSTAELARARAIGVVAMDATIPAPTGRILVRATGADRALLGKLLATPQVPYHAEHAGRSAAELVAPHLEGTGCALVIDDGHGEVAVIVPSTQPRLVLRHRGVQVAQAVRKATLFPVAIEVDADAIVPSDEWNDVRYDAGIRDRDLAVYEARFVRAVFAALAGARPAELLGAAPIEIGSALATDACAAFASNPGAIALPAELVARLRTVPLARLMGSTIRHSLDELAPRFPAALAFVREDVAAVPGFVAVVAPEPQARAFAVLLGRPIHDATVELETRRTALERDARLAKHRAQPVVPLALPDPGPMAEIADQIIARGLLGLSRGGSQIDVRVEGRAFALLRYPDGLPVDAVVEIGVDRVDEGFAALPADVVEALVAAIGKHVPDLLVAIAAATPEAIVAGPAFALLHVWIASDPKITKQARHALRACAAFRTVQGDRISLAHAGEPRNVISSATWTGEWLGPGEDESPDALDEPVLQVTDPALATVIAVLHLGRVVDVTADLDKLQSRRRMARGLIPKPRLAAIPADRKRALGELGDLGKQLGHGEIGLADADGSVAFIHVRGELVRQLPIDVLPVVHVALESEDLAAAAPMAGTDQLRALGLLDPEPSPIDQLIQTLAERLVRIVGPSLAATSLSRAMRRGFGRAAIDRRLEASELVGIPCLELVDGHWTDARSLVDQIATFGNAWSVPNVVVGGGAVPLDDNRRVFVLAPEERERATDRGYQVIDATEELSMDARARKNRARQPQPVSLGMMTIARVELAGDGQTASKGVVGLLASDDAGGAGIRPFRSGQAFDTMKAGCAWPTVAAIEDARFTPDRTWDRVVEDGVWHRAHQRVREASEQLVATLGPAPASALVSLRVTPKLLAGVALPDAAKLLVVAGSLWLEPRLGTGQHVEVTGAPGFTAFDDGTPVSAHLFTHGATGFELRAAITALAARAHAQLVRALLAGDHATTENCVYHAALALALERIAPADVRLVFPCFSPHRFDAAELVALFTGRDFIDVIDAPDPKRREPALIADGSHLSRLVRSRLGKRARVPMAAIPPPPPTPAFVPPPREVVPMPRRAHELQPIATLLENRLAALGLAQPSIAIAPGRAAMVWFDGELCLAGDHPKLRALLAMHLARDANAAIALDALAAHAVTVLNVALTAVTDATESHALARLLAER